MRAVYINLERATDRRTALEQNFAAHPREGWTLTRHPAVRNADPGDAMIVEGVRRGGLCAYVTFPFLTTLAPTAEASQIQVGGDALEATWNAYPRLAWHHADRERAGEELARLFAAAFNRA